MLELAALLVALIGIAHSLLGERYILMRLFRRELPKLFGTDRFTRQTLRFAWHLTTVLLFGIAAMILALGADPARGLLLRVLGVTLIAGGALPLIFTRGKHLAWPVFMLCGAICLFAA